MVGVGYLGLGSRHSSAPSENTVLRDNASEDFPWRDSAWRSNAVRDLDQYQGGFGD